MSPRRCFQPEFQNGRWTSASRATSENYPHAIKHGQVQLRLPMGSNKPKRTDSATASATAESPTGRPGIDQLLSTRDVDAYHRQTPLHRLSMDPAWQTSPPKRAGGGCGVVAFGRSALASKWSIALTAASADKRSHYTMLSAHSWSLAIPHRLYVSRRSQSGRKRGSVRRNARNA